MSSTWLRTIAAASLVVGIAACGDDEVAVPTGDELATHLITADTYDGEWSMNIPDDAPEGAETGVVTDETQGLLPRMELCDAASDESRAAVDDVQWMAFRQLDLAVADPIRPPDDRTGHMVFVQEYLTAGEPDEIEATFGLVRDGMQACLGEIAADEEGPGLAVEMDLPDVGDDRYGVLMTMEEAGGWAEWRLHSVLVRDGAVLVSIVVTEIRADAEPLYTIEDVGAMVTTAVDQL